MAHGAATLATFIIQHNALPWRVQELGRAPLLATGSRATIAEVNSTTNKRNNTKEVQLGCGRCYHHPL